MNYKNAASTSQTRNFTELEENTGNIYESVVIMSKRANHISAEFKEELKSKLQEFASSSDNLEEVFENREQIEISKHYERLPKPTLISTQEFLEKKIYHRNPEREG
ncbi:MAG TPA: DNA-directed RNA polymerase subunit omega [Bacteroidia bacterium]|nr:DNA-directed RNA polymerase subunit omega [Bacteroidia bacterium]HNT80752.1 DNA-directed RNA polymerase subunit omega [Bacteroidia bacterium]